MQIGLPPTDVPTVERRQLQEQADDQLRLAAVSVVLDAPTCDAAIARATLAFAVLRDKLPQDFVERVRSIRAVSFPTLATNYDTGFGSVFVKSFGKAIKPSAAYTKTLARAVRNRDVPCRALEQKAK